jgi:4-hydroxybenzoate polyprenyltransferase
MTKQFRLILKTMRPRQWPKNVFLLAGLVFDGQLTNPRALSITLLGFVLFCLVSSLVYIINDLTDIETDRLHPTKQKRPLASGQLSKKTAVITAVILFILIFPISFILDIYFGIIISSYFLLMLAYSLWLKRIPIIDVMVIAAGFVLRVAAGVVIITTNQFSPWLFVATTFLALFIAIGKRRSEIDTLESVADAHRQVLKGYSLDMLDQMLTIILATTMMTYCLYTFASPITPGNHVMMLTIPFVIYGLLRYLYLIRMEHIGGAPEEIILTDLPMQLAIGLWGLAVIIILYIL